MKNEKISFWPLASVGSWLFVVIVFGGWFFGSSVASSFLIAFATMSSFFAFFPKRVSFIENFLDNHILRETHIIMTIIGVSLLMFMVLYFFKNYKVVSKKNN